MKKHETPEVYRIVYRCTSWKTKSERYYTAFHSSEALADIYHTFHHGKINSRKITIYDIEEYDRYSNLWVSRMDTAIFHAKDIDPKTLHVKSNKIILRRG